MNKQLVLGWNIKVLLNNSKKSELQFADSLGYSADDVSRLCEGRLYSDKEEVKDIATFFGVSTDEILQKKTDEEYMRAGCIHYNHTFKDEKNLDTILDLFDIVCDIKEAL